MRLSKCAKIKESMLFNSLQFLIFFPIVVSLYWVLDPRWRNPMLLIASYYFYMNWNPVYALLIALSTITTWGCGILILNNRVNRRLWLIICLSLNIGILFFYKYADFVGVLVHHILSMLHISMYVPQFTLLLPVGISFYTFQAIGYTIDIYRGDIKPESNLMTYALFVAFFPQLVAGPIERAKKLLPQFHQVHYINHTDLLDGVRMMLWGFFMKLCIADSVAPYVDAVYNNLSMHTGTSVWLATIYFTFQIFCDFGGYSLIAIGVARCMGFRLMQNFRQPYLSRNVKDFWHRWHISLSSWFADYIYKPLGGSRCSTVRHQRNLIVTFAVSGLWHGANWTFVIWGLYHGMLQVFLSIKRKIMPNFTFTLSRHAIIRYISTFVGITITFILTIIGWSIFRANNLSDAGLALSKLAHPGGVLYNGDGKPSLVLPTLLIILLIIREIRDERHWDLHFTSNRNLIVSALSSAVLIIAILLCAHFESGQFIYFQF